MYPCLTITVSDPSHIGAARRETAALSRALGFGEVQAGRASIVVTEIAGNLLKHAARGQLLLRPLEEFMPGLEILALDKGPGMADVTRCLGDGFSTAGSPGTGLGAISRLSDSFDIYSQPNKGTVLVARLWANPASSPRPALKLGAVCAPWHEGDACGDAWTAHLTPARSQILLVDGLGHGPLASQAAQEALRAFHDAAGQPPAEVVREIHGPLRSTRGASLAVTEIDLERPEVRYAGVGNITGTLITNGTSRSMVSHNGTVGHEMQRVTEFTYPWSPDSLLILHSDGLISRWSLAPYPGLTARHPSLIAAVLFRDYYRGRDDASVVVARQEPP